MKKQSLSNLGRLKQNRKQFEIKPYNIEYNENVLTVEKSYEMPGN